MVMGLYQWFATAYIKVEAHLAFVMLRSHSTLKRRNKNTDSFTLTAANCERGTQRLQKQHLPPLFIPTFYHAALFFIIIQQQKLESDLQSQPGVKGSQRQREKSEKTDL